MSSLGGPIPPMARASSAKTSSDEPLNVQLAKLAFALLGMTVLFAVSYYYPYPNGERPTLGSLLLFWNRDLITYVFGLLGILIVSIAWAWKQLKALLDREGNEV